MEQKMMKELRENCCHILVALKIGETLFESIPQLALQMYSLQSVMYGSCMSCKGTFDPKIPIAMSVTTSSISIVKSTMEWMMRNRKDAWIEPPPQPSAASLIPVFLYLVVTITSGAIGGAEIIFGIMHIIDKPEMKPEASGYIDETFGSLYGDNRESDTVDVEKFQLIAIVLAAFSLCWNYIIMAVPSRKHQWHLTRTIVHGLSGVGTIACYLSYIHRYNDFKSKHAYASEGLQFLTFKYDESNIDSLSTFIFNGDMECAVIALTFSVAHLLMGLVVLPSRSFKARLFSPVIAFCLFPGQRLACLFKRPGSCSAGIAKCVGA